MMGNGFCHSTHICNYLRVAKNLNNNKILRCTQDDKTDIFCGILMKYRIFGKIISGSYHYIKVVYQYIWEEVTFYPSEKIYDVGAKSDAVMPIKSEKYITYMLGYVKKLENLKDKYVAMMRVVLGIDADTGQFLPKPKGTKLSITQKQLLTTILGNNAENVIDTVIENGLGNEADNSDEPEESSENQTEILDAEALEHERLMQSLLTKIERIKTNKQAYLEQITGKNSGKFFSMTFFTSEAGQSIKTEIDTIKNNVLNLELYYNHEMHDLPLEISQASGRLKSDIQTRMNHIDYYVTALKECDAEYIKTQYASTASCFDASSYSDITDSDFNFNDMPETVAAAIEKYVPYRLRAKIFDFSQPIDVITEKMSQSASELTQIMQRYFREFLFGFLEKNIFMMPHYKVNRICNRAFRWSG